MFNLAQVAVQINTMSMLISFVRILLFASCLPWCHGYEHGAPAESCDSMVPNHGYMYTPQTSAAPYFLTINKSSYTYLPGEEITVTIHASANYYLKGYLVQARKVDSSSNTAGQFRLRSGQTNFCQGKASVTQSDDDKLTTVSFSWTAPTDYAGDIIFMYTIVYDEEVYWVKVLSEPLKFVGDPSRISTSPIPNIDTGISLDPACSVSKSCIHDCSVTGTGCTYLVSWMDGGGDTVEFTLKRQVTGDTWNAVGFGSAPLMARSSVALCESVNGNITVKSAYNTNSYTTEDLSNPFFGVTMTSGSHANGVLSCTFSRAKNAAIASSQTGRRKRAATDGTTFFDLNTDWFISLAYGKIVSNTRVQHTDSPMTTLNKINLQAVIEGVTAPPTTKTPPTTIAPPPGTQVTGTAPSISGISLDPACSVNKSCMHDCSVTGTGCTYLVSWMDGVGDNVEFTLKRQVTGDAWNAIGFGKTPLMDDASVCSCDSAGGVVSVTSSYNKSPNLNEDLKDPSFGVNLTSGSHADGVLSCTFSRAKTATIASSQTGRRKRAVTADGTTFFDLNTDWFIQLAYGSIIAGKYKAKHTVTPVRSPGKINFQTIQASTAAPPNTQPPTTGAIKKVSECGVDRGCLHDCDSNGECSFLNTWVDNGGDDIEFTMRFKTGGQNMYTAMGLSSDVKMGDDSVIECVTNGNTVEVFLSYNLGDSLSNSRISQSKLGITWIRGSHQDGIMECVFSRKKTFMLASNTQKRAATDASTYFDLNSDWYLLHARGSAIGGYMEKHTDLPVVSAVKADFQANQDLGVMATSNLMIKAHGIMMVLAWCLSVSVSIILARYCKTMWGDSTLLGQKVWFQVHRSLMVLVLLLVTASFVLIFVDVRGYSQMSDTPIERAHPIMGIIVMLLTIVNPIMAMFRPGPKTSRRPIFNMAHFLLGTAAYIIATLNIFSGVILKLSNVSDIALYILWGWLGWQVAIEIILRLYDCGIKKPEPRVKYEAGDYAVHMSEPQPVTKETSQLGKKVLILVHVFITAGLSVGVSVVIGQS